MLSIPDLNRACQRYCYDHLIETARVLIGEVLYSNDSKPSGIVRVRFRLNDGANETEIRMY
jgi:hypothetical protein